MSVFLPLSVKQITSHAQIYYIAYHEECSVRSNKLLANMPNKIEDFNHFFLEYKLNKFQEQEKLKRDKGVFSQTQYPY